MAESSSEVAATTASSSSGSVSVPVEPSASPRDELEKPEEFIEPERKRRKLHGLQATGNTGQEGSNVENQKPDQKLEHRLNSILCCVVCFDLPRAAVYQVFIS